jgi:hypothetical protein
VRKIIWLVDPERRREIVEPGFEVQKTRFEKRGSLVLVEAGFRSPPAAVSFVAVLWRETYKDMKIFSYIWQMRIKAICRERMACCRGDDVSA